MIRQCEKCTRGKMKVLQRSHSHISTIKHKKVNLQKKTVDGKRILICTRCIKSLSKPEKVKTAKTTA